MARTRERWRAGDSGWEVEWCVELPCYPDDPTSADVDRARYESRDFRTRAEADACARRMYPADVTGSVSITPFVLTRLGDEPPYGLGREYTADPDYYEGD